MKIQNVMEIRKTLEEENRLITAFGDMSVRGGATTPNQQHSKGRACTNSMLQHELFVKYDVEISPS
eukprot:3971498-Ditylum_brightwellii.AAC.1